MNNTGCPTVFPLGKRRYKFYYDYLAKSYPTLGEGLKRFVYAYLASVAAMNENVEQVLDALERRPYRDDTVVVFARDHGCTWARSSIFNKLILWEERTRVPLVVRAPGVTPGGSVARAPVSPLDLFARLVDWCGLEGGTWRTDAGLPLGGFTFVLLLEDPEGGAWDGPDASLSFLYSEGG